MVYSDQHNLTVTARQLYFRLEELRGEECLDIIKVGVLDIYLDWADAWRMRFVNPGDLKVVCLIEINLVTLVEYTSSRGKEVKGHHESQLPGVYFDFYLWHPVRQA